MAREDPKWHAKWERLVEGRARAKGWVDAGKDAGWSERQAKRIGSEPEFKQAVEARIKELRDEDRAAFLEHRRDALKMAGFALRKQLELAQSSQVPAAVLERLYRSIQEHARALFPGSDVAELEQALAEVEGMVRLLASGRGLNGSNGYVAAAGRPSPN